MRISKFVAVPLIGVLIVLGACSPAETKSAETTPPATTPPAATPPATTPPATPPATTPTGPANFVVSDMKINEEHLQPEDTATVSIVVTNTGAQSGTYAVVMKINGTTNATKSVTLDGGKSETVSFGIRPNKELKADITIDNLKVSALWEIH